MIKAAFSRVLLTSAVVAWLICIISNFKSGAFNQQQSMLASGCFLGALVTSFAAGAVYGMEAESEKHEAEEERHQDAEAQPLLRKYLN
jgi:hypothetical protein